MKRIFTILALSYMGIGFPQAQTRLLYQDFSSSNNVEDYVGVGAGQFKINNYAPSTGDGFSSRSIIDSQLQFNLKSTYAGPNMYGARAQMSQSIGTAKAVKLQFKLNYSRTAENASNPKSLIMWLQGSTGIYFGSSNPLEYFNPEITIDMWGRGTDTHSQAFFYTGNSEKRFIGEHLITILINSTYDDLIYNSIKLQANCFYVYVDGILQGGHAYRLEFFNSRIDLGFETAYYNNNYTYEYQNQTDPMSTHTITLDNILIEDITAVLPVKLINFAVSAEKGSSLLQWQTAEEVNSDRFEIEHSMNAKDWETLDHVLSIGDTKDLSKYQYNHRNPRVGINYYRLKMIDRDETFAYSSIKNILITSEDNLRLFPNPVSNRLYVESDPANKVINVQIMNTQSILLVEAKGDFGKGITLSALPSGFYFVSIQFHNGSVKTKKILVQR